MKIYIASPKESFLAAQSLAFLLMVERHDIVSSWLFAFSLKNDNDISLSDRAELAKQCLAEIDTADMVVLLLSDPQKSQPPTGGAFIEFGYALQTEAICCTVGPVQNIFQALPQVEAFYCLEEFFEFLEEGALDNAPSP